MEEFITVGQAIILAVKGVAGLGGAFCFGRAAFKCFWCKESFKDAKNDALAGVIGIVTLLLCDKIADWVVNLVGF